MSLSFDDKILGEKVNNYCSSSDEDETTKGEVLVDKNLPKSKLKYKKSLQTGPKGVLEDYNRFTESQLIQQHKKMANISRLAEKFTLSCRPYSSDVLINEAEEQLKSELENIDEDVEFLKEYRRRRMTEMQSNMRDLPIYKSVFELSAANFIQEIDNESPLVTIVIHVYEPNVPACASANKCIDLLCKAHSHIKFCRLRASAAHMSENFTNNGVPAILVYKNKELIGNLISISKELEDHFTPNELEEYLFEHGFLPHSGSNLSSLVYSTSSIRQKEAQSDSD